MTLINKWWIKILSARRDRFTWSVIRNDRQQEDACPKTIVSVWQNATAEGKFASRTSDKCAPFPLRVLSRGEKGNRVSRQARGAGREYVCVRVRVYVCMCMCVEMRDATYVIASPADRILDRCGALLRSANKAGKITGSRPVVSICARARRLTGYWRAAALFVTLFSSASLSLLCWNLRLDSWHSHTPFPLVFAANEAKMEKSMSLWTRSRIIPVGL